jgi:hypothetical protein
LQCPPFRAGTALASSRSAGGSGTDPVARPASRQNGPGYPGTPRQKQDGFAPAGPCRPTTLAPPGQAHAARSTKIVVPACSAGRRHCPGCNRLRGSQSQWQQRFLAGYARRGYQPRQTGSATPGLDCALRLSSGQHAALDRSPCGRSRRRHAAVQQGRMKSPGARLTPTVSGEMQVRHRPRLRRTRWWYATEPPGKGIACPWDRQPAPGCNPCGQQGREWRCCPQAVAPVVS